MWQAMRQFTDTRTQTTSDEIWVVEHFPVYTQGQSGKAEHIYSPGDIPIVQTDRGGQVTYHGPGQVVIYLLLNLARFSLNVRGLVTLLEQSVVTLLANYGVTAQSRCDAPGVYVHGAKICSLGLRVRRGCCYHGLAFNVDMDLSPFLGIHPCGYPDIKMTQLKEHIKSANIEQVKFDLVDQLVGVLQKD